MSLWTEDRITRLKTLWREGYSAEVIARDLGVGLTRHAVLGKVRRLGLSTGETAHLARGHGDRTLPVQPVALDAGATTLLSVRRHECRWPYGDPHQPEFRLCGSPVARGAYCEAHAAVAYRGRPPCLESLVALVGAR